MTTIKIGPNDFLVNLDSRGRVNLSKITKSSTHYKASQDEDGTITLVPLKLVDGRRAPEPTDDN